MIDTAVLDLADARAIETERGGVLHPDVVSALTEHGIFRRWVASEFGGDASTVSDTLHETEALSRADRATGWCVMIANTTALTSHHLPAKWASEIYGDPRGCTGGFGMPAATGVPDGDDLVVTGRWAWGSGTDHCTWIGGGVRVVDADGEPSTTSDGASTPFVFFAPGSWHLTMNVCGFDFPQVAQPNGRSMPSIGVITQSVARPSMRRAPCSESFAMRMWLSRTE